jgi:hypothetical protein
LGVSLRARALAEVTLYRINRDSHPRDCGNGRC